MNVLIEHVEDGVCRLELNRPEAGNALSADLVDRLHEAVHRHAESGIHSLVLQGAGKHFCTGFDLSGLDAESDDSLLARFVRIELLLQAIDTAPFQTVALAQGRVMGAGADLFVACGQRIIKDQASFAFPGAAGFGLVLGTRRLAARVGVALAQDWVASGRLIDTEVALARGLATQRCISEKDGRYAPVPEPSRVGGPSMDSVAKIDPTQEILQRALYREGDDDRDLGLLTRSAARHGLKKRIEFYVQTVKAKRS